MPDQTVCNACNGSSYGPQDGADCSNCGGTGFAPVVAPAEPKRGPGRPKGSGQFRGGFIAFDVPPETMAWLENMADGSRVSRKSVHQLARQCLLSYIADFGPSDPTRELGTRPKEGTEAWDRQTRIPEG